MSRTSSGLFYVRFPHQNLVRTSPLPHRRLMPCSFIFLDLIGRTMFGENSNNEVLHYTIFSIFLSILLFWPNIFSIALFANNSAYVWAISNPEIIAMATCSSLRTVELFITKRQRCVKGPVSTPTQKNRENNNDRSFSSYKHFCFRW
jgi:hypothetical protein